MQTDATMSAKSRNRGRLSLEVGRRDEELLARIPAFLPYHCTLDRRTRDTNFKLGYETSILNVHDQRFRVLFHDWGMPIGKKSRTVAPPIGPVSLPDYVRGLVDGDGSIGFTEKGKPFVSFVTSSDAMLQFYLSFLQQVTGRRRKTSTRNARDDVYNVAVFMELAQMVAQALYYDGAFCLSRKMASAQQVRIWTRPHGMRRPYLMTPWTSDEDEYAAAHSVSESMRALGRTRASVSMRKWRLARGMIGPPPCRALADDRRDERRDSTRLADETG